MVSQAISKHSIHLANGPELDRNTWYLVIDYKKNDYREIVSVIKNAFLLWKYSYDYYQTFTN